MGVFFHPQFILVSTIISGTDLDAAHYPRWAEALGITLVIATVAAIPLYAVKRLSGLKGPLMHVCAAHTSSPDLT